MITATTARELMSSKDEFYAIIDSIEKRIKNDAYFKDEDTIAWLFTKPEKHFAFGVVNHLRNHGYHVTPHLNENLDIMSIDIAW